MLGFHAMYSVKMKMLPIGKIVHCGVSHFTRDHMHKTIKPKNVNLVLQAKVQETSAYCCSNGVISVILPMHNMSYFDSKLTLV